MQTRSDQRPAVLIDTAGLQALIDTLGGQGYQVLGPVLRDDAIVYDPIDGIEDLPRGWTDEQRPGAYRLRRRDDDAFFGFAVGPHSWKRFLHPPMEVLWRAKRSGGEGFSVEQAQASARPYAFIGVRACELHAIAIQDRVFRDGPYADTAYARRRQEAFIVALNCGQAGGNCFCVSMGSGPAAGDGFDLALTELLDGDRHQFLLEAGSERGNAVLGGLPTYPADESDLAAARAVLDATAAHMGRELDTSGIRRLLYDNWRHPRWDDVAERCLGCANCTMVCPTCFCTTVDDHTDLAGQEARRVRQWDSCFTLDHSYIHGGSVRRHRTSRYRQWLTHKLASWIDQFGTSGCVGCGRCITWCPVGIDITQEVAAIRADNGACEDNRHGRTGQNHQG